MKTSPKGIAFLERHEGVVLKAYRDPVGIWTIGAGLTKASGVVVPKAGMQITQKEASRLLALALGQSYEPAVAREMPKASQHEFDGGVSFHWNTGAIKRASWVKAWRAGDWVTVLSGLRAWRKGGGKVLPGLVRRREEEYKVIRLADYGTGLESPATGLARVVVKLSTSEMAAVRAGFAKLGYAPGDDTRGVLKDVVKDFQHDHDLTEDGIIGRATLSTLQRRLDAVKQAAAGATGAGAAGAAGALPESHLPDLPAAEWAAWIALALCLAWLVKTGWDYRDVIAAKVQTRLPGAARFLRSF